MANSPSYVLQIRVGHYAPDEHPILKSELKLGRRPDNDVVLEASNISGHHAKLLLASETPLLVDLGSRNRTYLNGRPVPPRTPTPFRPGDEIRLGAFLIRVRLTSKETSTPPIVAPRIKMSARARPGIAVWEDHRCLKYSIERFPLRVGRAPDNEVRIQDPRVSSYHARIERVGDGIRIVDLGSRNGLFYQGQRVNSQTLQDGAVIYLGRSALVQFRAHVGFVPAQPTSEKRHHTPSTQALDLRGRDIVKIGRSRDNDIILAHPQVSRYHAMLERMGGRYCLIDLKSSNGTFFNEQRVVKEAWPDKGDKIRIGPYRLLFAEDGIHRLTDSGLRIDVFDLQKWVREDLNLLKNIYLSIYPQEFVALVGLSGAGKSTLMDAINGFRPATHGVVLVNGDDLYNNFDLYRNDMGYVPQKDIVHKELTIYEALNYAARLRMPADTSPEERHERVMEVIEELDLTARQDVAVQKLSGGQQKRVSIGVELLTKPRLFFLDEPTSGLDPGTEYKMMRLLRDLADEGRTVMLITHATKNVKLCDKVIFLMAGGYLAYYGSPEEALIYFDQYRTKEERRIKEMEFDDIYLILENGSLGSPQQWAQRYMASEQYQRDVVARLQKNKPPTPVQQTQSRPPTSRAAPGAQSKHISMLRQFGILLSRNLTILMQDKKALLMMILMPIILGAMDIIWGTELFDPVHGEPVRVVMMLFVTAVITLLSGALGSVYEIVKEIEIYKRERAINLKILPYVLSKVTVGILLALYQAGMLMLFKILLVMQPDVLPAGPEAYLPLYVTLFLGILCGYLLGLAISASVPRPEQAMLVLIVFVVMQIIFSGALIPLREIPGHQIISPLTSNRWVVEGLINLTEMGQSLVEDDCWDHRERERETPEDEAGWRDILKEDNDQKLERGCDCMGSNIFVACRDFPGVLGEDFYTEDAQAALEDEEFIEPPTPTPLPTLTPRPTATPEVYPQTVEQCQAQSAEQCENHMKDVQEQQEEYSDQHQEQIETYQEDLADEKGEWTEARQKAIAGAEGLLQRVFQNYDYAFQGEIYPRWLGLGGISVLLIGLIVFSQKQKDMI